jgi:hypothetical protein
MHRPLPIFEILLGIFVAALSSCSMSSDSSDSSDEAGRNEWRSFAGNEMSHRYSPLEQIDAALVSERPNRVAGLRIDSQQVSVCRGEEDPSVRALAPVRDAAVLRDPEIPDLSGRCPGSWVVEPENSPAACIEGVELADGGDAIEHAVDHQRCALELP